MTRSYDCDHPYDPTRHSPHGPCCEHPRECHPPKGLDFDKLENLHQSTTPGPWKVREIKDSTGDRSFLPFVQAPRISWGDPYDIEILSDDETLYPTRDADMAWIVAAHEAFPAMLHLLKALAERQVDLERENDALRERVEGMDDEMRVRQERDEL